MKGWSMSMSRATRTTIGVAAAGLLAGCGPVGPDYAGPEAEVPEDYRYESRKNGRAAAEREDWWRIFDDAGLNRLVTRVRAGNHELKAGLERIEQARAMIGTATADGLPQVSGSASARRHGVRLRRPGWEARPGQGRSGTNSGARHSSRLQRRLDLPARKRAPPGHRPRRPRP
jgi:outer membrane protein TolC